MALKAQCKFDYTAHLSGQAVKVSLITARAPSTLRVLIPGSFISQHPSVLYTHKHNDKLALRRMRHSRSLLTMFNDLINTQLLITKGEKYPPIVELNTAPNNISKILQRIFYLIYSQKQLQNIETRIMNLVYCMQT